jgi:hypothetical protein
MPLSDDNILAGQLSLLRSHCQTETDKAANATIDHIGKTIMYY